MSTLFYPFVISQGRATHQNTFFVLITLLLTFVLFLGLLVIPEIRLISRLRRNFVGNCCFPDRQSVIPLVDLDSDKLGCVGGRCCGMMKRTETGLGFKEPSFSQFFNRNIKTWSFSHAGGSSLSISAVGY